jgi:hypothetical protein
MSGLEKASPFFSLPLELREEIYKGVLSAPDHGPDILRTCHEIYTEARKHLYQMPLSFRSQNTLYKWLEQAPPELLVYVSEISIHLQDVDLKPILDTGTLDVMEWTRPHLLTPEIYQSEVEKLKKSLNQLPNVRALTIRALSTGSSFLYRDLMAQFLKLLGTSIPSLLDLCLEGEFCHQELQFLSSLKRLESFSFGGFSSSSPTAMAQILAKLKHLRSLALVSERAPPTSRVDVHVESTPKLQSFTGEVVRAINQLASFSVFESVPASLPNLFFTPEVLSSLQNHKALKHLSVKLAHTPDIATLSSLQEFLDRTSIERLELDWPNLNPLLLGRYNLLGEGLKVLWIRAKGEADAIKMLESIFETCMAGNTAKLKKVVLVRSTKYREQAQDEMRDRKGSNMVTENVSSFESFLIVIRCRKYTTFGPEGIIHLVDENQLMA